MKDKIKVAIIGCGNIANRRTIPHTWHRTTPKSVFCEYCMTAR